MKTPEIQSRKSKSEPGRIFEDFCKTVATLRSPSKGCPWDLKQDHMSLRSYMLEESYEAVQAMESGTPEELCEELGDVLLQVVLNAQIAYDLNDFNIIDVIKSINEKMIRRHPHVFDTNAGDRILSDVELKQRWEQAKEKEKEKKSPTNQLPNKGIFESKEVYKIHPASSQAAEIGKIASKNNFDWDRPDEVFAILKGEIDELEDALAHKGDGAREGVLDEIGDVFFSLSQLCRHLDANPELVAQASNEKFLKRFKLIEKIAHDEGLNVRDCEKSKLLSLWNEAKRQLART